MKVKANLWGKPRHKLSFFTLYALPVLRMDHFCCTKEEKVKYEFDFNHQLSFIIGWLFWVFEIDIKF